MVEIPQYLYKGTCTCDQQGPMFTSSVYTCVYTYTHVNNAQQSTRSSLVPRFPGIDFTPSNLHTVNLGTRLNKVPIPLFKKHITLYYNQAGLAVGFNQKRLAYGLITELYSSAPANNQLRQDSISA